jgi:hypothetical protein
MRTNSTLPPCAALAALAAASLLLATAAPAQPVQATLEAVADNTLYESASGSLSNGSGQFIFAGNTEQDSNFRRRGLVRFDLAGALPEGSTILAAELRMTMSRSIAGEVTVRLRRATSDWGEGASDSGGQEGGGTTAETGDATWIHTFHDTQTWDAPGGDFVSTVSSSAVVGGNGQYVWESTPEMVADAQSWFDDPANNFGWAVVASEGFFPTAKRFNSRENSSPSTRPRLVVTYLAPAPPPEVVGVMAR